MARFSGQIMRFQVQAHLVCLHEGVIPKSGDRFSGNIMPRYEERPAAIRRLGDDGQGARTIGRMDAIRNTKTMAGSDAGIATSARSTSRNLAHGFCVFGRAIFFVNP